MINFNKIKTFLKIAIKLSPLLIIFILFLYMTSWINNPLLAFSFLLLIYYFIFYKKININKKNHKDNNAKKQFKSERVFSEEDRTFKIKAVDQNIVNALKILKINSSIEDLTIQKIKSSYKREAKIYHPDNNGDIERMKEINKAYTLLKTLVIIQPAPSNEY